MLYIYTRITKLVESHNNWHRDILRYETPKIYKIKNHCWVSYINMFTRLVPHFEKDSFPLWDSNPVLLARSLAHYHMGYTHTNDTMRTFTNKEDQVLLFCILCELLSRKPNTGIGNKYLSRSYRMKIRSNSIFLNSHVDEATFGFKTILL